MYKINIGYSLYSQRKPVAVGKVNAINHPQKKGVYHWVSAGISRKKWDDLK